MFARSKKADVAVNDTQNGEVRLVMPPDTPELDTPEEAIVAEPDDQAMVKIGLEIQQDAARRMSAAKEKSDSDNCVSPLPAAGRDVAQSDVVTGFVVLELPPQPIASLASQPAVQPVIQPESGRITISPGGLESVVSRLERLVEDTSPPPLSGTDGLVLTDEKARQFVHTSLLCLPSRTHRLAPLATQYLAVTPALLSLLAAISPFCTRRGVRADRHAAAGSCRSRCCYCSYGGGNTYINSRGEA